MPSATASGADSTPNGNATSREHNQGNQDRKYTAEQKSAVVRVRKCSPTAFYDVLGLEEVKATVSDGEIKKAYRKLSLLTHPDKNGFEGADEAFKLVSRAFQILSDPEKRSKYDRFGGDPDNRFGPGSASASSPFTGFGRSAGSSRQGPMWEEEISPEEMFNQFFSGSFGRSPLIVHHLSPILTQGLRAGGGMYNAGPQFVFNLGGGPGFRVHQMGGARPRRRPRDANHGGNDGPPPTLASTISNLLPLLLLFIVPLLSTLLGSSDSTPSGPTFRFDTPAPPHTMHRITPRLKVNYYVNPSDVAEWSSRKLSQLDQKAEVSYVGKLQNECEMEMDQRQQLMNEAQGWFFQDTNKMNTARSMDLRSCRRLDELRDFFYVCRGHLSDKGFCTPIIDEEAARIAAAEAREREIEKVKKEWEEKQRKKEEKKKKKEKEKDKDKDKEDEDGEGKEGKEGKKKDNKDDNELKDTDGSSKTPDKSEEPPRIFALNNLPFSYFRNFYQMRIDRIRNAEIAKRNRERLRNPTTFPSVPNGDI
ncbi:MAG: hypothetical protein M1838_001772 [Thelocarpon superellum]|nr:MAG: hypothetical protein M1838_001772 [Thelocarpon superellum]